jgi:hypothetical protein
MTALGRCLPVCWYRQHGQTKGVCPSVLGGTIGIRTQISELATALQLRNPLRNRGKSGVNRGLTILVLRVKTHLFDPCRPPRKGFESLRFRQSTHKNAPSGAFFVSVGHSVCHCFGDGKVLLPGYVLLVQYGFAPLRRDSRWSDDRSDSRCDE